MSLRREIVDHEHDTRQYTHDLQTALEQIRLQQDEADGYPTHTVGASPPEARTPPIMDGVCTEVRNAADVDVPNGWTLSFPGRCGNPRPCPDHDVNDSRLNATERNAARNLILERDRQARIEGFMRIRALTIAEHRKLRKHLPEPELDKKAMLCTASPALAGYLQWCDPTCREIADPTKGGLCDQCWHKEQHWRNEHGLPERERTRTITPRTICTHPDGCTRDATPGRTDQLCNAHRMATSRARKAS